MLSKSFQMSDLGESSYVRGIEIIRDRSRKLLGLSQRSYINKVLKRLIFYFSMSSNRIRNDAMKNIPYASKVGSIIYAQVCTRPDIVYAVSVLMRF